LIEATVTPQLWEHFGEVHRSRTGPDAPLLIPWLLDGANEQTVATMLALLPEPVRTAYQDQWQAVYRLGQVERHTLRPWTGDSTSMDTYLQS
jgi:hypothetical protein